MAKATKKNTGGCFFVLIGLFLIVGLFMFLSIVFSLPENLALIGAVIGSVFLTTKWLGMPNKGTMIQIALFLIVGVVIVAAGLSFLSSLIKNPDHQFVAEEGVTKTIKVIENDSVSVFESNRAWQDNNGNAYKAALVVREKDFTRLRNHINSYRYGDPKTFWGDLYKYIDKKDGPSLDLVVDEFARINKEQNLNQMEFAEMVVTCVQDIPYSLVFDDACLPANNYEDTIKQVLLDCPDCCIGNVAYGIQNPVSFLQNLKGDCDTRTVLIYSILKHFDYDVAILNSDFYRHSIIGINIPAKGTHKIYKGKKYKVWETTSKYFEAGELPYSFNDITHWNVVLTSK